MVNAQKRKKQPTNIKDSRIGKITHFKITKISKLNNPFAIPNKITIKWKKNTFTRFHRAQNSQRNKVKIIPRWNSSPEEIFRWNNDSDWRSRRLVWEPDTNFTWSTYPSKRKILRKHWSTSEQTDWKIINLDKKC